MKKILVFSASYCSPCKELKRRLEILSREQPMDVTHIQADEDWQSAARYGIKSVPTMVIQDGDTTEIVRGLISMDDLRKVLF